MARKIASLLLIFLAFGCSRSNKIKIDAPKDVIPVDSMIPVMMDMLTMENVIKSDYPQIAQNAKIINNSGDSILKKYHLNFDRYKRSLDYYAMQQDTMLYIYKQMTDRFTEKQLDLERAKKQ